MRRGLTPCPHWVLMSLLFFLSPFPKNSISADGCRICWSGALVVQRLLRQRLCFSDWPTGTSRPRALTGSMFCWLRWPASSTAERGVPTAAWVHQPSPTRPSTPCGRFGSGEHSAAPDNVDSQDLHACCAPQADRKSTRLELQSLR